MKQKLGVVVTVIILSIGAGACTDDKPSSDPKASTAQSTPSSLLASLDPCRLVTAQDLFDITGNVFENARVPPYNGDQSERQCRYEQQTGSMFVCVDILVRVGADGRLEAQLLATSGGLTKDQKRQLAKLVRDRTKDY